MVHRRRTLSPRFTPVAWGVLVGFIAVYLLRSLSGSPQWLLDLEAFAHILRVAAVVSTLRRCYGCWQSMDAALLACGTGRTIRRIRENQH
jgi:polyether ionophore transport system permease protein